MDEALAILMYTPKAAAPVVEKLLLSAIANAENNLSMDRGSLYVAEVFANPGPTLKRYVAAAAAARPRCSSARATSPSCSTRSKEVFRMGQKVNPHGARVGVIKDWSTRWYADKKNFADNLVSDAKLRKMN